MSKILKLIENDLRRFFHYRVFHIVFGFSFLFSAILAFFPSVNASNIIYITAFIMPVVIFSFSLKADFLEGHMIPCEEKECNPFTLLFTKTASALLLQLIPIIFYILVLEIVRDISISFLALFFVYVLSVVVHILIGLSLSIISRTNRILSLNYVVYILVFCMGPIFFSNGLIPTKYQYFLIFSPAYLAGVIIDNVLAGILYSPTWLIVLSIVLQFVYAAILCWLVIYPFFKVYLNEFNHKGGFSHE